jgi:hypothetical protein
VKEHILLAAIRGDKTEILFGYQCFDGSFHIV